MTGLHNEEYDRIEALEAEIERLREALGAAINFIETDACGGNVVAAKLRKTLTAAKD